MSFDYKKWIILILVCVVITACEAKPADHPNVDNVSCSTCHHVQYKGTLPSKPVVLQLVTAPNLTKTKWLLVSFGQPGKETAVQEDSTITLSFYAAGQAGGSSGCNPYSAPVTLQGNTISFGKLVHASKSCKTEETGQQEQDYFQALGSAENFAVTGDWLTIRYDQGQSVLNLVKYPEK